MKRSSQKSALTLGSVVLALAIMLGSSSTAKAQFPSPIGTWDFVLSGSDQNGLVTLAFAENEFEKTFSGYGILVPKLKNAATNDRNNGFDPGRGVGSGTNLVTITTNLFGFAPIDNGIWYFDSRGRVLGQFEIPVQEGTNVISHGVSFIGKVTPGKRLTLVASTPTGKVIYKGVPFRDLPTLPLYWNGFKKQEKLLSIERFLLSPVGNNLYMMDGFGPTYDYFGSEFGAVCIASRQKKIAFVALEVPHEGTNVVLRASFGPLRTGPNGIQAKTKGAADPYVPFSFNAFSGAP